MKQICLKYTIIYTFLIGDAKSNDQNTAWTSEPHRFTPFIGIHTYLEIKRELI